jgi:hypothetical protein
MNEKYYYKKINQLNIKYISGPKMCLSIVVLIVYMLKKKKKKVINLTSLLQHANNSLVL